jgi:hypothetical protein
VVPAHPERTALTARIEEHLAACWQWQYLTHSASMPTVGKSGQCRASDAGRGTAFPRLAGAGLGSRRASGRLAREGARVSESPFREPRPPAWWQPPAPAVPVPPERPCYRESRPVRWWTVFVGIVAAMAWYVLIGLAAWSGTSLVVGMVVGMALAGAAAGVLSWKGERGLGIGVGMMVGFGLTFLIFLGVCFALISSIGE